jgi:hypothetical protein
MGGLVAYTKQMTRRTTTGGGGGRGEGPVSKIQIANGGEEKRKMVKERNGSKKF